MKCKVCKQRERKGNTHWCDPCRLKQWRKDNPERVKAYARMRYERDIEKIKEYGLQWRKENPKWKINYYHKNRDKIIAREKERQRIHGNYKPSEERRKAGLLRKKTAWRYPLKGEKCQLCKNDAEHRHHTTTPMEVDKFMFLCKTCHDEVHGKIDHTKIPQIKSRDGEK